MDPLSGSRPSNVDRLRHPSGTLSIPEWTETPLWDTVHSRMDSVPEGCLSLSTLLGQQIG